VSTCWVIYIFYCCTPVFMHQLLLEYIIHPYLYYLFLDVCNTYLVQNGLQTHFMLTASQHQINMNALL